MYETSLNTYHENGGNMSRLNVGRYVHNYNGIVTQTSADTFFCLPRELKNRDGERVVFRIA